MVAQDMGLSCQPTCLRVGALCCHGCAADFMLKIHAAFIPASMTGAEGAGVTLPEWGTAQPSRSFTVATDGLLPKFCAPPAGIGKLQRNEPVRSRVLSLLLHTHAPTGPYPTARSMRQHYCHNRQ